MTMGRPRIDVNENLTAIARIMVDGLKFDSRMMSPAFDKFLCGADYFAAREHVIGEMLQGTDSNRHALRCLLDGRFREITRTNDKDNVAPDMLRLMAVDARLPGMADRHPDLAAAIDLDRLTLWRRRHPGSLEGWLRVQLDLYP
jgi:hypothetical protein